MPHLHLLIAILGLSLMTGPALAHVGIGDTHGFSHGYLHPLGGLDHVLAMVTVGLFAAMLGGRALWAVTMSFVAMMVVGGALGMLGVAVPAVEIGILASVVVLGGAVALGRDWPVGAAMALVGLFAVFHGHAHGAEMPVEAGALSYGAGFVLATALLHGAGLGLGLALRRHRTLVRLGGATTAAAGLVLALGALS